jgi:hypothetical protein
MTVEKEGTAFSTIQRSKPKEILVVEHEVKFYQNINLASDSDRNAGIPLFAGTRCELKAGAKVTTVCLIGVYNCHILTAGNNYAVFERVDGSLDCALVKANNILPVLPLQRCNNNIWIALIRSTCLHSLDSRT